MIIPPKLQGHEFIYVPLNNRFYDKKGGLVSTASAYSFMRRVRTIGNTPDLVTLREKDGVYGDKLGLPSPASTAVTYCVSPDNEWIYIGNDQIHKVNAESNTVEATWDIPQAGLHKLTISPDGAYLLGMFWHASYPTSITYKFDTATGSVIDETVDIYTEYPLDPYHPSFNDVLYGGSGEYFYTTQMWTSSPSKAPEVTMWNAATMERLQTMELSGMHYPNSFMVLSQDGTKLYAAAVNHLRTASLLCEIDTGSFTIARSLTVPGWITGLALNHTEEKMALALPSSIAQVDIEDFSLDWTHPGIGTNGHIHYAWVLEFWDSAHRDIGSVTIATDNDATGVAIRRHVNGPSERGLGLISDTINPSIWRDKTNSIFVGATEPATGDARIWMSDDEGRNYVKIGTAPWGRDYIYATFNHAPDGAVFTTAVKYPTQPSEIWLCKSIDGCATWTDPVKVGEIADEAGTQRAVIRVDWAGTLWAMQGLKQWVSFDGGQLWDEKPLEWEDDYRFLSIVQVIDGAIVAAGIKKGTDPREVWSLKSVDNGETWEEPVKIGEYPNVTTGRCVIGADIYRNLFAWVSVARIWRSIDGSRSWTQL